MKKPSNRDRDLEELNQNIIWNEERKNDLQSKIQASIQKENKPSKWKHVLVYASSAAVLFLVFIIGYPFMMGTEQEEAQTTDEEPLEEIVDQEESTEVEAPEEALYYYGVYDEEGHYETIALTDTNAMYFIPAAIKGVTKQTVADVNFHTSEPLKERLQNSYELSPARSDIPLLDAQLENGHLHLFFKEEHLTNVRGSTGVSMGSYSVYTFARNWSEDVQFYTAYGNGVPFDHYGEEWTPIDIEVNRHFSLLPVNTGKGIFLRQHYKPFETLDELFDEFFANHDRPDYDYPFALSEFSVVKVEEGAREVTIYVEGMTKGQTIEENSLKELIAHGLGANIYHQPQLFEGPKEVAKIYVNNELVFDGKVAAIRYNFLDLEIEDFPVDPEKTVMMKKAETAFSALENEAWSELAELVHPTEGLLFSHYAYVEKETDPIFTKQEVALFGENDELTLFGKDHAKDGRYYWFTPKEYIENNLIHFAYTGNPKVPYSLVLYNESQTPGGGIINNIEDVYPNGRFVEYYAPFPSYDQSFLWQGLRFVFEKENGDWFLVAIVRDIHSP